MVVPTATSWRDVPRRLLADQSGVIYQRLKSASHPGASVSRTSHRLITNTRRKLESNVGPFTAENRRTNYKTTQYRHKRDNKLTN